MIEHEHDLNDVVDEFFLSEDDMALIAESMPLLKVEYEKRFERREINALQYSDAVARIDQIIHFMGQIDIKANIKQ